MSERQQALKVLGLPEGASDEEIRVAYKKLSMKWHPDKNQGSSEATHMMQQLNAAKDKLDTYEHSDDEYNSEDDYYDSEDEYEDDDYDDEDFDPFSGPSMNFAAFLRMYARMRASGQIDDNGMFQPNTKRGGRPGEFCCCPECARMRRGDKEADQKARREAARMRKIEQEAEAAAERARDEADRKVQLTDPKNSLAWKRGGESRERLIREHFLKQSPRLILHEVSDTTLLLVLDAPDLSLLDKGKLPPKGVEWEVSYQSPADKKAQTIMAMREYDNVIIAKLQPGTEYTLKVRTGLAGNHTWSGTPDWGGWSKPQKFSTTGSASQSSKGSSKGSKKKKNRDAAFAKLTQQEDKQQSEEPEADEHQQQQDDESEEQQADEAEQQQQVAEGEQQQQQQYLKQQALTAAEAADVSHELELSDTPELDAVEQNTDAAAAAAAVEEPAAAEPAAAAAAAGPAKHVPRFPQICQYLQAGKCMFGNNCKYRHALSSEEMMAALAEGGTPAAEGQDENDPKAAAAQAAAAHAAEVDKLDKLMGAICSAGGLPAVKAAAAAALCNKIAARTPVARYQPAPVTPEGAYLKPLFLTAYNVLDNSYAAWYRETVLGDGAKKPSERKQVLQQALAEQPAAASAEVRYQQQQQPAAAAAAGSGGACGSSPVAAPAVSQSPQLLRGPNYKTKPCQWYAVGSCKFGEKCAFLHLLPDGTEATTGAAPAALPNGSSNRQLCRWFPLGTCKFGSKCAFRHILPDGTEAPTAGAAAAHAPASAARVNGTSRSSVEHAAVNSNSGVVQLPQQQAPVPLQQQQQRVQHPQQPQYQQLQQQANQPQQQQQPQYQHLQQQAYQPQQQQQPGYPQQQYFPQQQQAVYQQQVGYQQQLGYRPQPQQQQHPQPQLPQQQQQYNPLRPLQQQLPPPTAPAPYQSGAPAIAQPYRPF